jgi:dTMP kinase
MDWAGGKWQSLKAADGGNVSAETIKHSMRSLLSPLAQLLVALEISPSAITWAGLALSALAGLLLGAGAFVAGAIVLLLSGLCDMLDGMVARASGKAGRFGAVADSVSDRYADAFVLLGLFYFYGLGDGAARSSAGARPAVAAYLALAAVVGSFMISYVRARAEGMGLECKIGLLERPWRMVLLIVGSLLGSAVMVFILLLLAILTHATAMQRVLEVRRQFARREAAGTPAGGGPPGAAGQAVSTAQAGARSQAGATQTSASIGESPRTAQGGLGHAQAGREAAGHRRHGGLFVTLEGVEGSGKSTQVGLVADALRGRGREVVVTREPGGTAAGESIRELLLDSNDVSIRPETELLLYMASRAQHVRDVISPALDSGAVVICDRFSDATLAYQSGGRGLSGETVRALDFVATGGLKPDLTILLDLTEEEGLARAEGRGGGPDRMERESDAFHGNVRRAYLEIASKEPGRVKVVDGTESPQAVTEKIVSLIEEAIRE